MFTDGGTSLKPSDNYTVPLCHKCHQEQHRIGELAFWGSEEMVRKAIKFAVELTFLEWSYAYARIITRSWMR